MDLFVEAEAEHRPWKIAAGVAAAGLLAAAIGFACTRAKDAPTG